MPFRERVKRALGRAPKDPNAPEKEKKKKSKKQDEQWEDWPEHIYKPHEMPRPKYRRPADPAHKEHLNAYSWDSNTPPEDEPPRSKSHASMYSPMGSRIPSRMGSFVSRLGGSRVGSRAPSVVQEGGEGEGEEESVGNVGLSRYHSHTSGKSRRGSTSKRFSVSSRPGTSTAASQPPETLEEQPSSAERTQSATPRGAPADDGEPSSSATMQQQRRPREGTVIPTSSSTAPGKRKDSVAALDDDADGAELTNAATITQASEARRRERASTVKHDQPFSQEDLERRLTSLQVQEGKAVAAAS